MHRHDAPVEQVYMWGSTDIVDGDLSPIAAFGRLRTLRVTARKKYVPSVQSMKMAIGDISVASRGIGREVALALGAEDARVVTPVDVAPQ
jgi:hypothetical protein